MRTRTELNWSKYLRLFTEQNRNRPTRLGVFAGEPPAIEDLWIEDGLPFVGVEVDPDGESGPTIDIILDNGPDARSHMTRRVLGAKLIKIILSDDGEEDGLDIDNEKADRTVLRFEKRSIYGGE